MDGALGCPWLCPASRKSQRLKRDQSRTGCAWYAQSCHTAIVDGYVIEGHVPAADIKRLLKERPQVKGLSVPGMPVGSPGMEVNGVAAEAYDVIAFQPDGATTVFASYGK
ncbi:MAG: DUF411 domain-containing protein [Caldilineaceae bacterium]